jgi:preprotein translocase subunit Sec61beta
MGKNQQKNDVSQSAAGVVSSSSENKSRLPRLDPVRLVWLAVILVVVAVAVFFGLKLQNKHEQNSHVSTSINKATSGDYKGASSELTAAYDSIKDPAEKADKAYTIGLDYYYAHDTTNGDKWMITAEQGFRSVKNYERATQAAQTRLRFDNLKAETPAQSQNTGRDSAL